MTKTETPAPVSSLRASILEEAAQVAENFDLNGLLADGLPKGWAGCRRRIAGAIRDLASAPAAVTDSVGLTSDQLCTTPLIEELVPTNEEWEACEVVQDRYNLMKRRVRLAFARAAAIPAPQPNVEPCQHKEWSTGYDHCQCKQCGSFRTDSGWGIASHTWFKSRTEAEFYQKNGRLPDPLPSSLKPGVRS